MTREEKIEQMKNIVDTMFKIQQKSLRERRQHYIDQHMRDCTYFNEMMNSINNDELKLENDYIENLNKHVNSLINGGETNV